MRRRLTLGLRLAAATALLAVVGCTAAAAAGSASAANDDVVSLSALQLNGTALTGLMTVRTAHGAGDLSSLSATIGGRAYPVTLTAQAPTRRSTVLVVDTSGSMGAVGMATVRSSVGVFLKGVPPDVAVGLVSFAQTAVVNVRPTTDRAAIQRAVAGLRSTGETSLYDAVVAGVSLLGDAQDRSLIVLSDGGDTVSRASRASATSALRTAKIRAEVIGFKTGDSDNTVLAEFAAVGSGSVASAGDSATVTKAFQTAARVLDSQVPFTIELPASGPGSEGLLIGGSAAGLAFRAEASIPARTGTATPTAAALAPDAPSTLVSSDSVTPRQVWGVPLPLLIGLGAVALGLLGLSAALLAPLLSSRSRERAATIERYVSRDPRARTSQSASNAPSAMSTSIVSFGDKVMKGRDSTPKTLALIVRADLPLRAGEWWVLRLVALVVCIATMLVLFTGGPGIRLFAALFGTLVGWFLPAVVLRFLARRRTKKFEAQLPEVLMLAASSLSTGFSLLQALDAVAKDSAQPAGKEFGRALAEARIGAELEDALDRLSDRMDSTNMRWTTMAIRIQRQVGGNLAETLKTTAKTLRDRESLVRHVKALSAEGKLSAYILIAMPFGLFLYTMKTNREYVELLWTRPLGLAMLAVGLVSLTIGTFWMRKVVDVQV